MSNWRKDLIDIGNANITSSRLKDEWISKNKDFIWSVLPLIDRVPENDTNYRIYGTSFLLKNQEHCFMVTAAHCIMKLSTGSFNQFVLGFQHETYMEQRLIFTAKEDRWDELCNTWIVDKINDIAILPIELDDKIFEITSTKLVDFNSVCKIIVSNQTTQSMVLGYGHGKSGSSKNIDFDVDSIPGVPPDFLTYVKEKGHPVWTPWAMSTTITSIDKSSFEISVRGVVIDGFSGGPLIVYHEEKLCIMGVIKSAVVTVDSKTKKQVSAHKGKVVDFSLILQLISDNESSFNPFKLRFNDLHHVDIAYSAVDEFRFVPH